MVEISEIKYRESLEAWLEGQPREVAVWIASRAAARLLPFWWHAVLTEDWARKDDLTALPVLRSLIISSVAAVVPIEDVKAAASAAADAAANAAYTAAAATAYAAVAANVAYSDTAAFVAANVAANVAYADTATWDNVRADAKRVEAAGSNAPFALWDEGAGPLQEMWDDIVAKAPQNHANLSEETNRPPPKEDWSFWIDWYQSLLDGRPLLGDANRTLEMLTEIALIDPKVWDKGPEVVNPVINEIWRAYKAQGLSHGERFELDTDREVFVPTVAVAENVENLQFCLDKLQGLDELVQQFGNLVGGLRGELFLIRHAVERHPENPAMLWNNVRSARNMLAGTIASGACPEAQVEPAVGLFETGLVEVETLLAKEPEVQAIRQDLEPVEIADQTEALAVLSLAGYEIAQVVEPETAADMHEVLAVLDAPAQSRAMRAWAASLTAGRVFGVFLAARYDNFKSALAEGQDVSERVKIITKNLVVIGATGGAAIGVVRAVLNSDIVAKAIDVIMRLF